MLTVPALAKDACKNGDNILFMYQQVHQDKALKKAEAHSTKKAKHIPRLLEKKKDIMKFFSKR
jgi:hypothetical protein